MNLDIKLIPDFLPPEQLSVITRYVADDIDWRQEWIEIYNRRMPIPRLQAFYADQPSTYTYSNTTFHSCQMTPILSSIKEAVQQAAATQFNSILLNRYPTGLNYVSWHSDDEPELGSNPIVASLSIGATRKFYFKNKTGKVEIHLPNNSLLIMGPSTQPNWRHCLPKTTKVREERISLTFRQIQGK